MSDARISLTMLLGWLSRSLNTLSITLSSVAVVSYPQNAACPHASQGLEVGSTVFSAS